MATNSTKSKAATKAAPLKKRKTSNTSLPAGPTDKATRTLWVIQHRGELKRIAEHPEIRVKPQYVSMIMSGKRGEITRNVKNSTKGRKSQRIIEMLRQAGAPI